MPEFLRLNGSFFKPAPGNKHGKHSAGTVRYTYIDPIVTIVLGWMLPGEKISLAVGVGVLVTLGGVYLVNSSHLARLRVRFRKSD